MSAIVLPSRSRFALAMREPNLLVSGEKPVRALKSKYNMLTGDMFGVPIVNAAKAWQTSDVSAAASGVLQVEYDGFSNSSGDGYLQLPFTNPRSFGRIFNKTLVYQFRIKTTISSFWRRFLTSSSILQPNSFQVRATASTTIQLVIYGRDTFSFTVPSGSLNAGNTITLVIVFGAELETSKSVENYLLRIKGPSVDHFERISSSLSYSSLLETDFVFCEDAYSTTPPDISARLLCIVDGAMNDDIARNAAFDPFGTLFYSANAAPFLISVPAGGGTPTLSSPSVINVLSDRATPQVTLTF